MDYHLSNTKYFVEMLNSNQPRLNMKALSTQAARIFEHLVSLAPDGHAKICNNDSFMAVSIERIQALTIGEMWSVCHYSEQNGDLMRDPEVTFLVYPNQMIYPTYFRNDYAGIEYDVVLLEDGKPAKFYSRRYDDLRQFCNQWMKNIKQQQF